MLTPIRRACLLLLATPALALANPIVVKTHATGTTSMVDADLKELPYDITITSTFDTTKVREFEVPGTSERDYRLHSQGTIPYVIELTIGDKKYEYAGMGTGYLYHTIPNDAGSLERFEHEISIDWWGGAYTRYAVAGSGPVGSFGEGGLLATRNIDNVAGMTSTFVKASGGGGPSIDYTFGSASTFFLQVSPVPEPASYALLAGGLLVLGWKRQARGKAAG